MDRIYFIQKQIEILETTFPKNFFLRKSVKNHPAYKRWELCKRIIGQGGKILSDQQSEFPLIGRIILDSAILISASRGNLQELKFGSINLFGNDEVINKIQKRVIDPQSFEDTMVELSFAAWHLTKSHEVELLETEGFPDIKIRIPTFDIPAYAECKRISADTLNNFKMVLKKASKQIGATNTQCYGIAALDISTPVTIHQVTDDALPEKVKHIVAQVEKIVSGEQNRNVGIVALIWDDFIVHGTLPQFTLIAYRRGFVLVRHSSKEVKRVVPDDLPVFEGFTVE